MSEDTSPYFQPKTIPNFRQNCQTLHQFSDQNGSIEAPPYGTAHTFLAHVKYTSRPSPNLVPRLLLLLEKTPVGSGHVAPTFWVLTDKINVEDLLNIDSCSL